MAVSEKEKLMRRSINTHNKTENPAVYEIRNPCQDCGQTILQFDMVGVDERYAAMHRCENCASLLWLSLQRTMARYGVPRRSWINYIRNTPRGQLHARN